MDMDMVMVLPQGCEGLELLRSNASIRQLAIAVDDRTDEDAQQDHSHQHDVQDPKRKRQLRTTPIQRQALRGIAAAAEAAKG